MPATRLQICLLETDTSVYRCRGVVSPYEAVYIYIFFSSSIIYFCPVCDYRCFFLSSPPPLLSRSVTNFEGDSERGGSCPLTVAYLIYLSTFPFKISIYYYRQWFHLIHYPCKVKQEWMKLVHSTNFCLHKSILIFIYLDMKKMVSCQFSSDDTAATSISKTSKHRKLPTRLSVRHNNVIIHKVIIDVKIKAIAWTTEHSLIQLFYFLKLNITSTTRSICFHQRFHT